MNTKLIALFAAALFFAASLHASPIIPAPASSDLSFHFEAGLSYSSGIDKVADQLEQNFGLEKKSTWPIRIKFSGYAEYANGLAVGASIGPFMFIQVEDRSPYHTYGNQESYVVPSSLDVRFFPLLSGPYRPYLRAGLAYPFSGGDQIGSGTVGPVTALGLYFWSHRIMSLGVEAGYDGSEVEIKGGAFHGPEKVRPVGFTFSVFASF